MNADQFIFQAPETCPAGRFSGKTKRERPTAFAAYSKTAKARAGKLLDTNGYFLYPTIMKKVLCILENGFEEIEAITPVDLLRRAGLEVVMAGASSSDVVGRSGIQVRTDMRLGDPGTLDFDALLLPGGPAVMALRKNPQLLDLIRCSAAEGKIIAAICAAPLLLHDAGVLEGKNFTAHFSTRPELPNSREARVVEDANIITSRGAGTAMEFGLALIVKLVGKAAADEVAAAIMA
jgi:4-methyl-5(b-hydroxyethyl)-thiazole monophosphate biosynthesis